MSRSRGYVFTLNNWTEEEAEHLRQCGSKYLIFGKEVGENGTPHLQGYVYWANKKSLKQMKKLNGRAHWEQQRGTAQQAIEYCKKDGEFEEHGVSPEKIGGDTLKEKIKKNKRLLQQTVRESVDNGDIGLLQLPQLKKAKLIYDQDSGSYQAEDVRGEWYWGPPGTGKSRKARDDNPGAYIKAQNKWWDGYTGEKAVILDDLDTNVLGHYLKIWADRYACTGEVKGGTVNLQHDKILVTSNYHPEKLWEEDQVMCEAIKRRFKITYFTDLK